VSTAAVQRLVLAPDVHRRAAPHAVRRERIVVLRSGQLPCLAVVAVPWKRPADGDDQAGVGVDDDLVVGGVPVVLRGADSRNLT
jgi:hypothetical protein